MWDKFTGLFFDLGHVQAYEQTATLNMNYGHALERFSSSTNQFNKNSIHKVQIDSR